MSVRTWATRGRVGLPLLMAMLPGLLLAQTAKLAPLVPPAAAGSAPALAPALALVLPAVPPPLPIPGTSFPRLLSHGLFNDVALYRPAGVPQQFVMLPFTGMDGANDSERLMIQKMVTAGAMVATIPLTNFYRRLEVQDGKCTYAGGAFENLSRQLQASEKLGAYMEPMLVGTGSAGAFAYALVAQAPAGTFASALSVGFCPRLPMSKPMCAQNALRWQPAADGSGVDLLPPPTALPEPWTAMQAGSSMAACPAAQDFVQRVPQAVWQPAPATGPELPAGFDSAYASLAARQVTLGPPPAQLADLPVIEVPATAEAAGGPNADRFAVLLSGDGGWASIDKGIAAAMAAKGIPLVGVDSLRYFWSARTPEGLATDLDRLIRFYSHRWKRSEVILIGYSQGADVLPFAVNRLPAATRTRVRLTALLGLGQKASFEFHLSNWIGPSGDRPIAPEAQQLVAARTLCIYGQDEKNSLCPTLAPLHARPLPLAGGHHFGGDYDALAGHVLASIER
ncbi:AcvB/VirJ family lysyl-phosphatidylglycerol hydrolase [Ideonella azotifigens]|uniref:AcvB/VirJ family lysyl-phosphatidylglycerol hydrolase n=2 Tax=Ideonella azotifigens TaxID=513160 RepID=UPI001E639A8D|nr:AcvB/VirJ family lysyl-phosphatidylglycerol hydrolase [Ideonella azotifigens]